MQASDMQVIKDIPGYKVILKAVLKSQIQQLVSLLVPAPRLLNFFHAQLISGREENDRRNYFIISTVILLPSADLFKKGWCQLQAKVCAQITG